jgi:glutamine amidotransferase
MDVAIIDYGLGNVASLLKSLQYIGKSAIITNDIAEIQRAKSIFLPGVGSFGEGMRNLKNLNLIDLLNKEVVIKKKPFFGICLGMQLLAERGFESGDTLGLGWIKGDVIKIETEELYVPHLGWNNLTNCSSILKPFQGKDFYFIHSYHLSLKNEIDLIATVEYGNSFTAAIQSQNIFATQFHPEKSQTEGLELLKSFFSYYD